MKSFIIVLVSILCGCSTSYMEPRLYIDEFGTINEVERSLEEMNNPKNWKSIGQNEVVTICNKKIECLNGCTSGKQYTIKKYVPKSINMYRLIVYKNDFGNEEIFLVENLPYENEEERLINILDRIDP
ncbi:MAG: hypothetical protein PF572_01020 [Patescibacteria group bacterium]|jgi:hypothetical protein|nr:hypothetical protein [Patescibacteria group bacterium]